MQQASLYKALLKQNTSGKPDKDFLEDLTKAHPYFTPAHFFLLQSMADTDEGFNKQAAKTAVLFNNPYWLQFQLQQGSIAGAAPIVEDNMLHSVADYDEDISLLYKSIDEILPTIVDKDAIVSGNLTAPKDTLAENNDNDDDAVIVAEKPAPTGEEALMLAQNADNDDDEVMIEEEIAPIRINIKLPDDTPIDDKALTFEPMHLVDYFASQGIKLTDEVQTADKLGKQLKSFTEWLKTMKKIHVTETQASAGLADMMIQTLAAKSNTEGEVLTEAMAEVLVHQGKTAKAIEVYKKLSLLNPSKNAFFAAKIDQLKG